jgi:ElaB/YqjD/DUF883 family membrane-anchored ribosome-binding protein
MQSLREAEMAMSKAKTTNGHLGEETAALRQEVEQLTAAIEKMAKAEGADAVKAAGDAAREVAARAASIMDELAGNAQAASAVMDEGRKQLEQAIREKPLTAISIAALAGFVLAALLRR